jgi:DNA-binding transcriptional regulator YhcF (GntR family)
MKLRIDLSSDTPAYRQIADAIRILLVEAKLAPGDRLPPARQIALDLGIHFNTVAEAYRILAEEGWLDLKRRRGAVVIARAAQRGAGPDPMARFTNRMRTLVAQVRTSGATPNRIARELRSMAEGLEQ